MESGGAAATAADVAAQASLKRPCEDEAPQEGEEEALEVKQEADSSYAPSCEPSTELTCNQSTF